MAERLTNYLITNEIIKGEDKDIYYYGLRQGFLILINIITTIVIGLLFKMIWQTALFMCAYVPLRTYGGGYHAKTEGRCYLFSLAMIIVVLFGVKLIPLNKFVILSLLGVGSLIIWFLAPVEDVNKLLDEVEKKTYRKRSRVVLTLEIAITLLAVLLNINELALVISTSVLVLAFMLIIGRKHRDNLFKFINR